MPVDLQKLDKPCVVGIEQQSCLGFAHFVHALNVQNLDKLCAIGLRAGSV
jgi:hypothetical protein